MSSFRAREKRLKERLKEWKGDRLLLAGESESCPESIHKLGELETNQDAFIRLGPISNTQVLQHMR